MIVIFVIRLAIFYCDKLKLTHTSIVVVAMLSDLLTCGAAGAAGWGSKVNITARRC